MIFTWDKNNILLISFILLAPNAEVVSQNLPIRPVCCFNIFVFKILDLPEHPVLISCSHVALYRIDCLANIIHFIFLL